MKSVTMIFTKSLRSSSKGSVCHSVYKWNVALIGAPDLFVEAHGDDAGEGVECVEEMVLECPETTVVYGYLQTPGQDRNEKCNGE